MGFGSILNVTNQALTLDHWHRIIRPIQEAAQRTRLKIPVIYGVDSIHGANYVQVRRCFLKMGMAATWNPQLMQGRPRSRRWKREPRNYWSFSPVLDVGRHPMWPRLWETFGEDPYLAT
jgi:beta-glucosidase